MQWMYSSCAQSSAHGWSLIAEQRKSVSRAVPCGALPRRAQPRTPAAPIWGRVRPQPRGIHRSPCVVSRTEGRPARSSRRMPARLQKRRKSGELIRKPRVSRCARTSRVR